MERCFGPLELRWMRLAGLKPPGSVARNRSEASPNGGLLTGAPGPEHPCLGLYRHPFEGATTVWFVLALNLLAVGLGPVSLEE